MSLIADVFDVLLIDSTGDMFASSTLSTADINITVDTQNINAGRGNALISMLHSNRQADIKLAEMTFKWDWIANQLGKKANIGAAEVWALPRWYTASGTTTVKITLDEQPIANNSGIKMYKADGTEITSANYSIAEKDVTFTTGVVAGDTVEVRGYKYTTAETASTIEVDNISFAKGVKCILETLEINEDETELAKVQYIFDSVLPTGNLTISTKKERDASVTNFEFKAVKPLSQNTIGRFVRIPLA